MFKELFTESIAKKGDEFKHKNGSNDVKFIEFIRKIQGNNLVKLEIIRGTGKGRTKTISDKVFRSNYDLNGKVLG